MQSNISCSDVFSQVVKIDDKLSLTDGNHFINLCNCLESIIDDYDDTAPNVEENQPIIDFENGLEFSSLRSKVEASIVKWENLNSQDGIPDPEDEFLAPTSMMSILNQNCEIIVGGSLYNFCEDSEYSIKNNEFGDAAFSENSVTQRNGLCLISDCCPINQELIRVTYPNDSDRRIKLSVYSYGLPVPWFTTGFGAVQGGKITAQRRNGRGNWRRNRQQIRIIGTGGTYRDHLNNCIVKGNDNLFHPTFRNRQSRDKNHMNTSFFRAGHSENEICTTGAVRNTMEAGVCNAN